MEAISFTKLNEFVKAIANGLSIDCGGFLLKIIEIPPFPCVAKHLDPDPNPKP